MGAAPEGPCDNVGGLDLALRQAASNSADFLHRPADQPRLWRIIVRLLFAGEGVGLATDGGQHCKGQHDERDVPVPAVPGTGLVVVEAQLVFGRLEAVLNGPAPALDCHQGFPSGPGGAPGSEKGQVTISDSAADQQAPCPKTGQVLVVFGGLKIGQFQVGPLEQPLTLGSGPSR